MDSLERSANKAHLTPEQRSILIDGWLSPRMKQMLLVTVEEMEKKCDFSTSSRGGFNRVDYIPLDSLRQDSRGIFKSKSFLDGYWYCFQAIATLLRRGKVPTVERIEEEVAYVHLYDDRKFQFYLEKGGRIEFALYAVIQITEANYVLVNGHDNAANPMSGNFETARVLCIDRGNGIVQKRTGPFRKGTYYDDSGDNESLSAGEDNTNIRPRVPSTSKKLMMPVLPLLLDPTPISPASASACACASDNNDNDDDDDDDDDDNDDGYNGDNESSLPSLPDVVTSNSSIRLFPYSYTYGTFIRYYPQQKKHPSSSSKKRQRDKRYDDDDDDDDDDNDTAMSWSGTGTAMAA